MAITKLMNIKQGKKGKSQHLYNSLTYVLNPDKTEEGLWIGGNVGTTAEEVYQGMLDTKQDWEKTEGRQGYHFVISFQPGETNEQTAYQVIRKFCEQYLGDFYDYVFALHNDHAHLHGHIIFNSVNRMSGYKYRYEKGDWEKFIQPVTDQICKEYGLKQLVFDEERKGISYAEWNAKTQGTMDWKTIIRADIDAAVRSSNSIQEFEKQMRQMGYQISQGVSKKYGTYYSFLAPGQKRAWRNYRLGERYSYEKLLLRISNKKQFYYERAGIKKLYACRWHTKQPVFVKGLQKKYLQTQILIRRRYRFCQNPYVMDQKKVRTILLRIEQYREETNYLLRRNVQTMEDVKERLREVKQEEKILYQQKDTETLLRRDTAYQEYKMLLENLAMISKQDDSFEGLQDRLEQMQEHFPDTVETHLEERIQKICEEKRLLYRIQKREKEDAFLYLQIKKPKAFVPNFGTKMKGAERVWVKK